MKLDEGEKQTSEYCCSIVALDHYSWPIVLGFSDGDPEVAVGHPR